jgi:ABC-type multidrug transport system ATPase subunit
MNRGIGTRMKDGGHGIVPTLVVDDVSCRFGEKVALDQVSLTVEPGEVHALLGPNGAGKTTLLRTLAGLMLPGSGYVLLNGIPHSNSHRLRSQIGLVPSGDRSFYLRISGLENLVFFGRLQGLRRRAALARAREVLDDVGLAEAADKRVGEYSHGMQKRLAIARALLTHPSLLLVDEATHDLDPGGARRIRDLVAVAADRGAAVVWATQRLDEIRGFADVVTVLGHGRVRFVGSVPELVAMTPTKRYVLELRNGGSPPAAMLPVLEEALANFGTIAPAGDGHYLVSLSETVALGDAVASLAAASVTVLACREERSQIEEAFLEVTGARE